jgi:subtilase family serine protease
MTASSKWIPALSGALMMVASAAWAAPHMDPKYIRSDVATPVAAGADSTAHFGCELRLWSSTRLPCYGPDAIRKAYGLYDLIASGTDGKGETIVIIDAYGSPTLEADLTAFDTVFGLPAPPSITQIHMPGSTPFDYGDGNQLGWAEESSLDVQWAHAIAPGAKIILVAAVDNYDSSLNDAQNYAIDNHLGHVISESFGESEVALLQDGLEGQQILAASEKSYRNARHNRISVFVSAGDDGSSSFDLLGNLIATPAPGYPASSPNVTSVGGTNLFFGVGTNATPNGSYLGEVVWNDGYGAGGGGISQAFRQPSWQEELPRALQRQLKGKRGYPDVAYNAGVYGGVLVRLGFLDTAYGPGNNGFYIFGGTSASAPQWAGIAALANQYGGRPVGFINKALYELGKEGKLQPFTHDVTIGDNSFNGVVGYPATVGFDLSTGWGTPKGIVPLLAGDPDDSPDLD